MAGYCWQCLEKSTEKLNWSDYYVIIEQFVHINTNLVSYHLILNILETQEKTRLP